MDSDGVSEGVIGNDIVIEVSVMVGSCDRVTDCGCVIVGVGVRVVGCVGVGPFVLLRVGRGVRLGMVRVNERAGSDTVAERSCSGAVRLGKVLVNVRA
jgi:hypothetical protein